MRPKILTPAHGYSEPSDLVVVLYLYLTALPLGGLLCFLILSILYYILIGYPQESVVIQAVNRWMERCLMPNTISFSALCTRLGHCYYYLGLWEETSSIIGE